MRTGSVGIIANPASGKDIRRLVAHGSTFDNNEKINIVRRVLLALDSLGVERVWHMPDDYAIVPRARDAVQVALNLQPLPMPVLANPGDSLEAARRLRDMPVDCVITLGGDGTNRMVAKGIGDVPMVAISTGTNNVFPRMIEGTIAGLAAGLIATNEEVRRDAVVRNPKLDVYLDGEPKEMALIDVVTSQHAWIGARALWDASHLREIVLSRIAPAEIGICGLGGLLHPDAAGNRHGVHIAVGDGGSTLLAPLAPGLMRSIPIARSALTNLGDRIELDAAPCTVALDGEREFEILKPGHRLEVVFNADGPNVVDVDAAIRIGAQSGSFIRR
ncbi:MAG: NAD(+)/NADH kinase [Thermomicrobiales bacterium]|nr:NAD(+)/NADH kinase [Thermomicrobiales bacterium]